MKNKEILLIRHGQAYNTAPLDGNREVLDRANPPLTALGERQAEELKPVLEAFQPDVLILSPFLRALQTALPYLSAHRVPVEIELLLGEQLADPIFADFKGLDLTHYQARFGSRYAFDPLLGRRESFPAHPESTAAVRERMAMLWCSRENRPEQRLVFIGHAGPLGALLNLLAPECPEPVSHVNTGVHHLAWRDGKWNVLAVNQSSHLKES